MNDAKHKSTLDLINGNGPSSSHRRRVFVDPYFFMRVIVVRKLGLRVPFPSPFVSVVFGDRGSVLPMVLVKKLLRPCSCFRFVCRITGRNQGKCWKTLQVHTSTYFDDRCIVADSVDKLLQQYYSWSRLLATACRRSEPSIVCAGHSVHGWIRVLGACSASTAVLCPVEDRHFFCPSVG